MAPGPIACAEEVGHQNGQAFLLPIVYQAGRTGLEMEREFSAAPGSVIAGRYRVSDCRGSAAFSNAWECTDLSSGESVCLKVIKNNKDYLDQSLDEIKLLQYVKAHAEGRGGCDAVGVLKLLGFFYHKEHLFLVTELLKENLFDFASYLSSQQPPAPPYFNLPRLQHIARQVLTTLDFIHSVGILHCDLKPENILIKSYSRADVKVRIGLFFAADCLFVCIEACGCRLRKARATPFLAHHALTPRTPPPTPHPPTHPPGD